MIKLNKSQVGIFGMPNFKCIQIARALLHYKIYEPNPQGKHNAEYEQAIVIHFLNALYVKHGDDWDNHLFAFIDDLRKTSKVAL